MLLCVCAALCGLHQIQCSVLLLDHHRGGIDRGFGEDAHLADAARNIRRIVDGGGHAAPMEGAAIEYVEADRKSVVSGQSVSVRVVLGGSRDIKNNKNINTKATTDKTRK